MTRLFQRTNTKPLAKSPMSVSWV